jgi:hypothetical protein
MLYAVQEKAKHLQETVTVSYCDQITGCWLQTYMRWETETARGAG